MHQVLPVLLVLCALVCGVWGSTPVALLHGIFHGSEDMDNLTMWVDTYVPNVYSRNIEVHGGKMGSMFGNLSDYTADFARQVKADPMLRSDEGKVNLVCHSQGALVCRGYAEMYAGMDGYPAVDTLVSLSGPHGGFFCGDEGCVLSDEPLARMLVDCAADMLAYDTWAQEAVVPAGYWKDPFNITSYLEGSLYMPYVNNEIEHTDSRMYKDRLLSLSQLVLMGSPIDGVIVPPESAWFGFYTEGSAQEASVVYPWDDEQTWRQDPLGLRALEDQGKVTYIDSGLVHRGYLENESFFVESILPFLL
ncbi:palmitoyl protein thioesterase [Kipferlia bialata]|uniref:Palmitoyl protein thioesterase n=1 Tax=Kipferlia bialata TaxID=797122 RepID=A0A9K3GI38_9EUKA|nr:palmitoyl protein thioesterase [Kipferlia bialata]|eukprot:g5375.t1